MKRILTILGTACLIAACAKPAPEPFSVVPIPASVTFDEGAFNLAGADVYAGPALDDPTRKAIDGFCQALATVSGKASRSGAEDAGQRVRFLPNPDLGPEAYVLNVTTEGVTVEASAFNGFFYAIQTLKQMLPADIYGSARSRKPLCVPAVSIQDSPRFAYRGMHMDPSRHFWQLDEVKRYIDIMAVFKLNRLHWHLTDDQGWRFESRKYPRLNEISAWRNGTVVGKDWGSNDGIRYGGLYTQDQMREIVAYAAARGITVIPEIDLPGHMVAALAAYPELGCTGGPYEVWTRWGVAKDILCAGNEAIYTFLEDILTEVMDVFPSEYIHIGGDECFNGDADPLRRDPWEVCPKCRAKMKALGIKAQNGLSEKQLLQAYVTGRMQRFLDSKGRKIIGWDEILEGDLLPGATVMSWRGVEGGKNAAERGFDAIMTPSSYLYFDYYQSRERDKEPFGIGGHLPLETVYGYEPMEGMPEEAATHILGVQANLWTEYIATPEHLEYMLLPRLCALSEIQWCPEGTKDYARFTASLEHVFRMLDVMGYNYCLDHKGLIGLDHIPARTEAELAEYVSTLTGW